MGDDQAWHADGRLGALQLVYPAIRPSRLGVPTCFFQTSHTLLRVKWRAEAAERRTPVAWLQGSRLFYLAPRRRYRAAARTRALSWER
jgi:hypothetical protein